MNFLILMLLFCLSCQAQQLLHRIDIKIEFTNGTICTNWFQAATNKFGDTIDRFDPDGRHISLRIINNNNGSNYYMVGSLMLSSSNKIQTIFELLQTNNKPAQCSGFVEWHQCPREGTQQGIGWTGCDGDPRAFYNRIIWP